jgi:hypothetical protein
LPELAFTIGTFCVAAAIIGGGLKAAHIWDMPIVDSVPRQALLGIFGGLLIAWAILLQGGDSNDPSQEASGGGGSQPIPTIGSGGGSTSGGSGGTTPAPAGCQVTIANPLTVYREQPENFAQEIGKVPAGTYPVLASRNVAFAGRTERWLQISVSGKNGWLRDNSTDVASKTAACA